jgi:DNA repair protein RecO (recombination protein O)
MSAVKEFGIPIRCVDYSNSSQIVTIFSRREGLVEGIAKGSQRLKSAFQGPFDLAVLYEVLFVRRARSGLVVFTESTVLEGFRGVRRDWHRYLATVHLIELLRVVTVAGEAETRLFDLTLDTLAALDGAEPTGCEWSAAAFDARALAAIGLLSPLDACVERGARRPPGSTALFISPGARGVLCRRCRAAGGSAGGVTLASPAVRALEQLAGWEPGPPDAAAWERHRRPVLRVLGALRTNLLERELVLLKSAPHWV